MMLYAAIVILIAFSAFFSSSEMAYTSVNALRLQNLAEDKKNRGARLACRIHENFSSALSSILIGNNLVNICASTAATLIAIDLFDGNQGEGVTVATVIITVVLIIFGEIIPKSIGKSKSLFITQIFSYPLYVIMLILKPLSFPFVAFVGLLGKVWNKHPELSVTEDELESLIDTAEEEEVIDEDQGELLKSALDFSDITVEEILTHRVKITSIDIDDEYDFNTDKIVNSIYSRIPVYKDSMDHIIGILQVNHFLKELASGEKPEINDFLTEPCFMHKTTTLPVALDEMREEQIHIAVIIDEYGGTMGIITMEDILEEIVGDIWDENEEIEHDIVQISDNSYDVKGDVSITDLFEFIDFDDRDFDSEYTTVGGWAIEMLDEDPHEGDSFTYKNLYIIVTSMGENIINNLSVIVNHVDDKE